MMTLVDQENRIVRQEICTLTSVRRIAAMLNLDPDKFVVGDVLPQGWHFFLLGGQTRREALREDGFPGFGLPLPDLGLPRLLIGGRQLFFDGDIKIGEEVETSSFISGLTEKQTSSGRIAILNISNELTLKGASQPAIRELQTYFLLEASDKAKKLETAMAEISAEFKTARTPDDTLLFQYCALGFNSHKIHLDRDYAMKVESLPDLVVNGGLITLLVIEVLRTEMGIKISSLKMRHTAPLYVNRTMNIGADKSELGWNVTVRNDVNATAVKMEVMVG